MHFKTDFKINIWVNTSTRKSSNPCKTTALTFHNFRSFSIFDDFKIHDFQFHLEKK